MKNTLIYFLLAIIALWLFGFMYIFFGSNRKNLEQNRDFNRNQNDLNNWLEKAEKEFLDLEEKNRRNDELINELR